MKSSTTSQQRARQIIVGALLAVLIVLVTLLGGLAACSSRGNTGGELPKSDATVHISDDELPLKGDNATIADVVEKVAPSVVEITTESVTTNAFMQQYVTQGAGSGVFISSNGYIITNNHVVEGATSIIVRTTAGGTHKATLIGTDILSDIAVIKIEGENYPYATYLADSDTLKVGQQVIAIGNPLGSLGGTVTEGIVSAKDRQINVDGIAMTLLQTSAAINPGNSGGGLFDMGGRLVGVVNAKSSGTGIEGLGFAIPANAARDIATQLITTGQIEGRKGTGFTVQYVEDASLLSQYGLGSNNPGLYIKSVSGGEDFKVWDYVFAVDGTRVTTVGGFLSAVNSHETGDKITVNIYRRTGSGGAFGGITYKLYTLEATVIEA